jgi:hypothetical protein
MESLCKCPPCRGRGAPSHSPLFCKHEKSLQYLSPQRSAPISKKRFEQFSSVEILLSHKDVGACKISAARSLKSYSNSSSAPPIRPPPIASAIWASIVYLTARIFSGFCSRAARIFFFISFVCFLGGLPTMLKIFLS